MHPLLPKFLSLCEGNQNLSINNNYRRGVKNNCNHLVSAPLNSDSFSTMLAARFLATARLPLQNIHRIELRTKSTLVLPPNLHVQEESASSTNTTNPIPNFDNARIAFESKSTHELVRAAACFSACKIPPLVDNAEPLLRTSRSIFGSTFVDSMLKATLYGHFCAGQDQKRIQPVMNTLRDAGVGSILDYAAENDEPKLTNPKIANTAREYDYESEAMCDQHVSTFLQCIRDVAANTNSNDGYAAIKVTALGNPKLLSRLSTAIAEAKRLFSIFGGNGDGLITRQEFDEGYK